MINPQSTLYSIRKAESISFRIRKKTRMPTLATFIQHNIRSSSHTLRKEKEIKGIQIGKEEIKLSMFADDLILYIEYSKDSIKKLLELINTFSKVAAYKINMQKSVLFLYNSSLSEK